MIGERQHQIQVVLDNDDRELVAQLVERFEQFLHHRGREALERLVQQQHAHVA